MRHKTRLVGIGFAVRASVALSVVLLTLVGGASDVARCQAVPQGGVETPWEQITSPALTDALKSQERLWAFLTDPHTPYRERMAAAVQGKGVLRLSGLVRLVTALDAVRAEQSLHRWGLKISPAVSGAFVPLKPLAPQERRRQILGHLWVVPETPTGVEPEENNVGGMEEAPWPLQVETALHRLFEGIAPQMHSNNPPADVAYAEQWYTEAFKLPCNTDRQALLFVDVTVRPLHYKSLRVLARWRKIALDPRFPLAAARVAAHCGEAMCLWGDERAQDIGQAMLCDILRGNTDPTVRLQAAWTTVYLLTLFTPAGERKLDPPMQVVVALGDLAIDPTVGSEWERLSRFVNPLFRLMPDAPMRESLDRLDPQSSQVHRLLETFALWFRAHRAKFAQEGDEQIRATNEVAAIRNPTS